MLYNMKNVKLKIKLNKTNLNTKPIHKVNLNTK